MPNEPPIGQAMALRALMQQFIGEHLVTKLEDVDKKIAKEKDPTKLQELREKREKEEEAHQPAIWLRNASKEAKYIRLATHAQKFTHPSAKGDSVFFELEDADSLEPLVGSACLPLFTEDFAVLNAKAAPVYKLLSLEYEGQALWRRVVDDDPALAAALSDDASEAEELMQGFRCIIGASDAPASHTLTRQVYFPLPDGQYHLLGPLFPTSLVHQVHSMLSEARFSEESKQARQAKKEGKDHPNGLREFPDLAVQSYGSTKPQNISQLNLQRRGENWLLPSLPPSWKSRPVRPPLRTKSIFERIFGNRRAVKELTGILAKFLSSTSYNNKAIRDTRADLVDRICDQLMQYAAEIHELPPGWSSDPSCSLDLAQRLWLDPGRAKRDEEFAALRGLDDWQEQVAAAFGHWLNGQLRHLTRKGRELPMGQPEYLAWKSLVAEALSGIREELAYV